ncbi:hypothetical protein [Rhodanobacter sp. OK091]|uniref:hypothetical protein n=1 Tax=Rhodanobacter sp. OK091 TaxID=1881037 RepID=UPI00091A24E6|nr:hypothetical protein [Rhodanobacter sp. OK091]SHL78512.1 hypothetical protein SAMN05428972_1210 [Rhodanobacter sp. OK091]
MSEAEMSIPTTARTYDAAIQSRADGKFISRFKEQTRIMFATNYGGPFFAISRLAPEIYAKPNVNLLLADAGGWYAEAGGRWLTLYAKALQPARKHTITVCSSRRPEYGKAPKPILFQPPQQVLLKSWDKHLQGLDTLPDLTVLPVPDDFERTVALVESLRTITAGHKALISCHLRAQALLVGALFRAYGFETSPIVGFDLADGEPQHLAQGTWWLSAIVPTKEHATEPAKEVIDELGLTFHCLRSQVAQGATKEDAALVAATIATRATVSVEGKDIRAVRIPPLGGIDLDTGRFFNVTEEAKGKLLVWDTLTTGTDLLTQAPAEDKDNSADEDRLNLMLWVAKVLAELDKREPDEPAISPALQGPDQEMAVDGKSDGLQKQPVADGAVDADAKHPGEVRSDTIPATRPQRPRLSRHAGAINVLALAARLGRAGQRTEKTFDTTRARILLWLKSKGFHATDPMGNNHIESLDGEVTIESDGTRIWSLRFDDRRSMEQGAIWRVEATLINGAQPAMGLRLIQVRSTEEAPLPVASGVPQVVADIAKDIGLMDAGTALLNTATHLSGEEDAPRLIQLLLNAERIQPVIVIAGDIDASADRLARRLTGVAHIVCIDTPISHQLVRRLGRERSVYGHAVRLYRPGFNAEADPYLHPVWPLKTNQLPKWLVNDLFEEACATSTAAEDLDERVPPFQAIRQHLAAERVRSSEARLATLREQATHAAASKDEQISQLQAIREELESALAAHRATATEFDAQMAELRKELQATRRERDDAREEIRRSHYQFHAQWSENEELETGAADESYYPDTWDELEEWVEIYGEGKLELHPKAAKAARESPFKDIPLAYKAMEYLVRHYVPMRTRSTDDNEAYQRSKQALAELGLEESDVGTADEIKRYKKEYQRQYGEKIVTLDRHLKRGVGFGGDFQFRLYFYYDDKSAKVLVGHMPTHLTNRLTHNG